MSTKYLDSSGLAYFWQKIKAYGNTHWGGGSSVEEIFIATFNETTYQEVADALADGKIVFAVKSNSYGTFDVYPYSHANLVGFMFEQLYIGYSVPQGKYVSVNVDDTWTTVTESLIDMTEPMLTLDTTATSGTDKEIYDALVSLGWNSDVIV